MSVVDRNNQKVAVKESRKESRPGVSHDRGTSVAQP